MDTIKASAESKMKKSIAALKSEYNMIRTGRASASIFDKIKVDYYGSPTPLSQVANLSAPEPNLIVIKPFDVSCIKEIDKAIQNSSIGITPNSDGRPTLGALGWGPTCGRLGVRLRRTLAREPVGALLTGRGY